METQHIIHNFEPIYNEHSKILMLGTMPSPKSRDVGRILRTFKIKKNVEVTYNGKIII